MEIGGNFTRTGPYLETVRSLHQTVQALRIALEDSKKEILELKSKAWPIDTIEKSLTALAIENHALRRKLLNSETNDTLLFEGKSVPSEANTNPEPLFHSTSVELQGDLNLPVPSDYDSEVITVPSEDKNHSQSIQETEDQKNSYSEGVVEKTKPEIFQCSPEIVLDQKFTSINDEGTVVTVNEPEVQTHLQINDQRNSIGKKSTEKEVHFIDNTLFDTKSQRTDTKKAKKKIARKKQIKSPTLGLNRLRKHKIRASFQIKTKTIDEKVSRSLDTLTVVKIPLKRVTLSNTTTFHNWSSKVSCEILKSSEEMNDKNEPCPEVNIECETEEQSDSKHEEVNQNDIEPEVDDIELIFTTDDTKDSDFKEQLVSIDTIEQNASSTLKLLVPDLDQSLDISDKELDDDVFDASFDQENQENNTFQVFQLKRDNSQLYNSKSDNSINQDEKSLRSYYSYQDSSFENKSMEKDESFDRFEERIRIVETDISKVGIQEIEYAGIRRNTCPNPLQYRPLLHREAMTKGLNVKKSRPILAHSNAIRKESGAQTDISALPGSVWRSESSLGHKAHLGDNFTTLPSKYPLPGSRLKLSEKTTVEARRVLLSDIGFTSMVPELSRSADHLCPSTLKPPATTYGQFLRTSDLYSPAYTSQRFTWTTTTATPSDGSHSHSRCSIHPLTPPVQIRRCSAPVSPSRKITPKSTSSRVRFANGSLPELRGDWTQMTADSGDSTDSLVEEAENYLRRSIDCILSSSRTEYSDSRRNIFRRASAPESTSDNVPPPGWQPFLPRQPRDLKLDHWVKVITSESKVKGGRVRYIGPVASQTDQFVGVQLAVPEGYSDGTYSNRRYFQCEPYHGIFVPFKKVIMGWRP